MGITDVQGVLDTLFDYRDTLGSTDGNIDLDAYRARINEVDNTNTSLPASVDRLTDLIDIGADLLAIAIGRSICDTLARLAKSAHAQAATIADGA